MNFSKMKLLVCEDCKKRTVYKGAGRPSFCCGSAMKVITSTKVNKGYTSTEEQLLEELKHLEAQQQGVLKAIEEKKKLLLEEQKKKITISMGTFKDPNNLEQISPCIQIEENSQLVTYRMIEGVWLQVGNSIMHTLTKQVVMKKQ